MLKRIIALIITVLGVLPLFFGCTPKANPNAIQSDYQNPVRIRQPDGSYKFTEIADPDVIRGDDGYFYFYSTATHIEHPERGKIFDLCPIFRSRDLVNWEYKGSVFLDQVYDEKEFGVGFNIWAPSINKINGLYYCYYSIAYGWYRDETGIGVATSPTPYGPWTHYGRLFTSKEIGVQNSIDPFVIEDSGKLHIIWGSYIGIYGAELSIDGLEILPSTKKVIIPGKDFLDIFDGYEATFIIKKDGKYYYMGSQGDWTTYNVRVGVSDSLYGPYVNSQGQELAAEGRGDSVVAHDENGVICTGHNTVIRDDAGDYWILYHGVATSPLTESERNLRSLMMDKLLWDEKTGMPYVEGRKASYGSIKEGPYIIWENK